MKKNKAIKDLDNKGETKTKEYEFLKPKTLKQLIAPSRNRCV